MIEFPNVVQNQMAALEKLAEELKEASCGANCACVELSARVKKLEDRLMALNARMGKHG